MWTCPAARGKRCEGEHVATTLRGVTNMTVNPFYFYFFGMQCMQRPEH